MPNARDLSIFGKRRAGGIAGYGPRLGHIYWQAASLVARVFRGERPQDMPVEQPTEFELVINLKTAKAIGSRADFTRKRSLSAPTT